MNWQFLGLALASSIATLSAAAQAGVSRSPAPADARRQVLNLMREWVAAENRHDAAALGRILDDKFISTSGAGNPKNKQAFIKALSAGDADPGQSQSLTDETVIVDGDTAVTVGTDTFYKAGSAGLKLRYTITCIRRRGHWVALAEHVVTIPR